MKYEICKGSISDLMQKEDVSLAESFLSCDCIVLFDVSGSMDNTDGTGKTRFDRGCHSGCTPLPLDVIGLYGRLHGVDNFQAIKEMAGHL